MLCKSGDSLESDASPRCYNGNGTHMYGVSEEEEEEEEAQLWREMAFAQESLSQVGYFLYVYRPTAALYILRVFS